MGERRDMASWKLVTDTGYPVDIKVGLPMLDGKTLEVSLRYRGESYRVPVSVEASDEEMQKFLVEWAQGMDDEIELQSLVGTEV